MYLVQYRSKSTGGHWVDDYSCGRFYSGPGNDNAAKDKAAAKAYAEDIRREGVETRVIKLNAEVID